MESRNTSTTYAPDTPEEEITGEILTCPVCSGSKISYINGQPQVCASCHGRGTVDNPTPRRIRMVRQERMQERTSRVWQEGATGVHPFEGDSESCSKCGHVQTNDQHLQEQAVTEDIPAWRTWTNIFGDEESNEMEVTQAAIQWLKAPHLDWFVAFEDRDAAIAAIVDATEQAKPLVLSAEQLLEAIEPWLQARSQNADVKVELLIKSDDRGRPQAMRGAGGDGIFMGLDVSGGAWADWPDGKRPPTRKARPDFQTPERVMVWQYAQELVSLPKMRQQMAAAEMGIPLALLSGLSALNKRIEFNALIISDLKAQGYTGEALSHEIQRYAQKPS